jgi:hypothetical protein
MKRLLAYEDELSSITPSDLVPYDGAGTNWKSAPITFDPAFTALVPGDNDRSFKADVSFRGLVLHGRELPLRVPYDGLKLWKKPTSVYVMDLHETVAEKVLGWCAHRLGLVYVQTLAMSLESIERNVRQVLAPALRGVRPAR